MQCSVVQCSYQYTTINIRYPEKGSWLLSETRGGARPLLQYIIATTYLVHGKAHQMNKYSMVVMIVVIIDVVVDAGP